MYFVNLCIGVGLDWFSKMCDFYICFVFFVLKVFFLLNVIFDYYFIVCIKEESVIKIVKIIFFLLLIIVLKLNFVLLCMWKFKK